MHLTGKVSMTISSISIMDNLLIESTKKTPEIAFNTDGRFRISGRSIPEDASKFYDDLFEWVYQYCLTPAESTTVDIELEYFNSGSSKALLHILGPWRKSTKRDLNLPLTGTTKKGMTILWNAENTTNRSLK